MATKTRDIRDAVKAELDFDPLVDASDITIKNMNVTVDASDGTVTLAGHVRSWLEHDAVIDAAWMGIDVRDDLHVTG